MLLDVARHRIGGGGGNRTRVRKPSALGPTCLARSIVFSLLTPEGQGERSAISNWVLADQVRAPVTAILCEVTPGIRRPQASDGQRPAGIKQRERSCRRWQL